MRRVFSPIGVGLVLLVATACAGERSTSITPSEPVTDASATASVTAVVRAESTVPSAPIKTAAMAPRVESGSVEGHGVSGSRPIGALAAELTEAVDAVEYRLGVAVLDLDSGVTYQGGDSGVFALASVSKLALTLVVLHQAELEGRELTWLERDQLGLMLSESKNGPAVALWNEFGGVAVTEALAAYGVSGFWMPSDEQWGDMAASATDVAMLMRLFVADDSSLREDDRLEVLALLQSVVAGQRWGVSAGMELSGRVGAALAIKNGWYPENQIWRVNSAGAVTVAGETGYVVVVLSDGAADFPRGVRVVEEIAAAVNGVLYPEELLVALPEFVPLPVGEVDQLAGTADDVATEPGDGGSMMAPAPERFVVLEAGGDVLVPAGTLLSSATSEDSFAIWFEVAESEVGGLLEAYAGSMRGLGWTTLSGPPRLLLSKQDEGRFVAVTALASASGGTQILEFRIAPVPATTVGAAAID